MERKGMERFAPLAGLVFLVLAIASVVVGGEAPSADEPAQEIVEFWKDEETAQIISAVLGAWAAVALVWFAGSVREAITRAEPGPGRLGSLALAGAAITAAGLALLSGLQFAAADWADDVPPDVTHTISALFNDLFFPIAVGNAVFLLAAGIGAVRHGAFDKRLGWIAIGLGVLSVTPIGFFALIGMLIWVGITSIVLYRKKDPVGSGAAPPSSSGPSIEVPPAAGTPPPA
jgi:hypothetical protein